MLASLLNQNPKIHPGTAFPELHLVSLLILIATTYTEIYFQQLELLTPCSRLSVPKRNLFT